MTAPPAAAPSRARAAALLEEVRALRPALEAAARPAEAARTLPAAVVAQLREAALFWMKTPAALGGSELDAGDFCAVLEEVAHCDASAAWATMVANGSTGTMAGWLSDEGVAAAFADPADLPVFAGQFAPRGVAEPVEGGYRVTGRWSFSSGIRHADWVIGSCRVESEPGVERFVTVRRAEATVHDTWEVAGLQGTGSDDFSLEAVFVPTCQSFDWASATPRRGGALFRQPKVLFVGNELSPVAVGIARRALDDLVDLAGATSRTAAGTTLAERPVFQRELGRGAARGAAVRALYREAVGEAVSPRVEDRTPASGVRARVPAAVGVQHRPRSMRERERDRGTADGHLLHHLLNAAELGGRGAERLSARWVAGEQAAHRYPGSGGHRFLQGSFHHPKLDLEAGSGGLVRRARDNRQAAVSRHGSARA